MTTATAYTIRDLGTWVPYTPDPLPDWAAEMPGGGGHFAFLQRTGDGADFYELRNGDPSPFAPGVILATTLRDPSTGLEIVKTAFRDPGMVFPLNQRLIEIVGVDPSITDAQNLFLEQVYDAASATFSPPPPPKVVSVADYQFAGQAAAQGIISDDDAMGWVGAGKTPQVLIDAVKATVTDPDRQKRVLLFLAGTTVFPRKHELTPVLAASFGITTPDALDAFFLAASQR